MRTLIAVSLALTWILPLAAQPGELRDDFSAPSRYERLGSAAWTIGDGAARFRGGGGEARLLALTPSSDRVRVEADVTVDERLSDQWTYAGLCLYLDAGNHWQLMLVEGPDGRHYPELLERMSGTHQAQRGDAGPGSALSGAVTGELRTWAKGVRYRLAMELTPEGITGTVTDTATGARWEQTFSFAVGQAVKEGRPGMLVRGCAGAFSAFAATVQPSAAEVIAPAERGRLGTALLLDDPDRAVAAALATALRQYGFGVTEVTWDDLESKRLGDADLVVLADARRLCTRGRDRLLEALHSGGKLISIGAPALSELLTATPEGYRDKDQWADAFTKQVQPVPVALPANPWLHTAGDGDTTSRMESDGEGAWHATVNHRSWDIYQAQFAGVFGEDRRLLVLEAKGDAATPELSLEFREQDHSRWIATIKLSEQWKRYVLSAADFAYWDDSDAVGRGGPGDRLRPQQVVSLAVGLSQSHTPKSRPGPHEYWFRGLSTAPDPGMPQPSFTVPEIEALCPSYKLYPLVGNVRVRAAGEQGIAGADFAAAWSQEAFSPVWRERGRGIDRDRPWRWVPVLEAIDADGRSLGAPVSLMIGDQALPNAMWANVAVADPKAALQEPVLGVVLAIARRMAEGLALLEGGSDAFSYPDGETITLGARALNCGRQAQEAQVVVQVRDADGAVQWTGHEGISPQPGRSAQAKWNWTPGRIDPRGYTVAVTLTRGGEVIDRIEHRIERLRSEPARDEEFVRVDGSQFTLAGKPWFFDGINFHPSSLGGQPSYAWMARERYDPEMIERDLTWLQSIGVTALSAIHSLQPPDPDAPGAYRDQLDFLDRCARHGMKAYVTLPYGRPYSGDDFAKLKAYIERAGLRNHPAIMSWELAWEPIESPGTFSKLEADWNRWIIERYGSAANAVADWGFDPRAQGASTVPAPTGSQCTSHGAWDRYVAAFRRAFSDLISARYRDLAEPLRAWDPNHLVTFRGGACGIPDGARFAHVHSVGVAKHMDFLCPEGYNLQHGWATPTPPDDLRKGGLVTLFYRFQSREKPIVWMEFGFTINGFHQVWSPELVHIRPAELEKQRAEFESFYAMFVESGARGAAPWWLPGGFRLGEGSDFGVLEPDGRERPAADVMRRYIPQFKTVQHPTPTRILDLDLDTHYPDAWKTYSAQYLSAVQAGEVPYVRTAGTGTDSATCPLVAVGGGPCNGHNPPQYLNAEFNRLEVKLGDAPWQEVRGGEVLTAPAGARVLCRASVGNLGEAKWLARVGEGRVFLAGRKEYGLEFQAPIAADVDYLKDAQVPAFVLVDALRADTTVSFEMLAQGRSYFGERRTLTLKVK